MSLFRNHIRDQATPGVPMGRSIQTKVAALVASTFLLFIAFGSLGLHRLIMPSFLALEEDAAQEDLRRVREALQREETFLASTAADWGIWTETWAFLGGTNPGYGDANLTHSALSALEVDILALFDREGRLVWGMQVDPDHERLLPWLAPGPLPLPAGHPLRATGALDQLASGLLPSSQGPLVVGMHSVTTNEGQGPVQGSVVFGRFLDEAMVARLADQAGVDLDLVPATAEDSLAMAGAAPDSPLATRMGKDEASIHLRHVLPDVQGHPLLAATVTVPRAISASGRRSIGTALGALLLSGLLVSIVVLHALGRLVVKPLQQLAAHAVRLGRTGQPSPGFHMDRRDELGVLSAELNQLMSGLADVRRRLLEQSFDSGRAEMAAGILHNIGNSITPLGAYADQARRMAAEAPLDELQLALEELGRDDLETARRRDVLEFARLAHGGTSASLRQTEESIARMEGQVAHIGRILAEQEASTHAGHVQEECRLDLLVRESVALLDSRSRECLDIEVEGDLAAVAPSRQPRVVLQQVLINLLLNAAEAIRRSGASRGRLRLGVRQEGPTLVLDVADEGCGFTDEVRERLFERGFTTKSNRTGRGLGLHWCSNTLHALGGALEAESPGPGGGARFRVKLPWPPLAVGAVQREWAEA